MWLCLFFISFYFYGFCIRAGYNHSLSICRGFCKTDLGQLASQYSVFIKKLLWTHGAEETRAPITCPYKKARVFLQATIDICSLWSFYTASGPIKEPPTQEYYARMWAGYGSNGYQVWE